MTTTFDPKAHWADLRDAMERGGADAVAGHIAGFEPAEQRALYHHALRAFGPRCVFLVWTDESNETTVYQIDLTQTPDAELAVPVKTKAQLKLDAKDAKSAVVLAWIGAQRALAALLPA